MKVSLEQQIRYIRDEIDRDEKLHKSLCDKMKITIPNEDGIFLKAIYESLNRLKDLKK